MRLRLPVLLLLATLLVPAASTRAATQQQVADYVRDHVLGGSFGDRTLWMTSGPLDSTSIFQSFDLQADVRFPAGGPWWLVMIDDDPMANWGHGARQLFVSDALDDTTGLMEISFPPFILENDGAGPEVEFACAGVTPASCKSHVVELPDEQAGPVPSTPGARAQLADNPCLWAILISGGVRPASNFSEYPINLAKVYNILRKCGYPKEQIFVYYANGFPEIDGNLWPGMKGDFDKDGVTEITSSATESNVSNRIRYLCAHLDPSRDILFIYMSNHGTRWPPVRPNTPPPPPDPRVSGLCMWENTALPWADNVYTAGEFSLDTFGCRVCRLFLLADQCFSGLFVSLPVQPGHGNMAVFAASTPDESSWGRPKGGEYMNKWGDGAGSKTMNELHDAVTGLTSHPQRSGSSPGDSKLCDCCDATGLKRETWGRLKSIYR